MAAMTVEQWQQLHQLVAKTVDTAGNHRYWSNTVKSLCCGSIKDKSYQSASHSRLSWCQYSLQGWPTFRKHFSSLVLYLEAASRTRSEISKSREQDDCYTVPHILNIPNVTLACNEAPAGIRMVIRRVRQEEWDDHSHETDYWEPWLLLVLLYNTVVLIVPSTTLAKSSTI